MLDHLQPGLRPPPDALVSRAAAVAAAERAIGPGPANVTTTAEPAILPRNGRSRLVWRVDITRGASFGSVEVLVDARTGRVAETRSLLRHSAGRANLFDPNPVVTHGLAADLFDDDDADSVVLTALRTEVTLDRLADASGCLAGRWAHARLPSGEVCLAGGDFSAVTRADDRFEAAMAYFHVDRARAYLQSLGFTSILSRPVLVNADATPDDDAFYDLLTKQITLGTGGVDDGEDGDVIAHEYAHAILDDQVPGFGTSPDAAALGEGFSDYFQGALSSMAGHPGEAAACLAEWDNTVFPSPCMRRLDSTLTLPQARADPACAADEHCVGQVWSAALWGLRVGLGTTLDAIVLQSQFALTASASFTDASRALLAADRQLTGGAHAQTLLDALGARGLLDPESLDDTPADAVALTVPGTVTGHLDAETDPHDVYRLSLIRDQGIVVQMTAPAGELDLRLLRPGSRLASDPDAVLAGSTQPGGAESFTYMAAESGDHFLDVSAAGGAGSYTIETLRDSDGDTRADRADNCPLAGNVGQEDRDRDGAGDVCDAFPADPANDSDHDGLAAEGDNCPAIANRTQADWDRDGRGDVCDRSSRALVERVRAGTRSIIVRGATRPASLPASAFSVTLQRRACPTCPYRTTSAAFRRHRAAGRITVTVRGLHPGEWRVRASIHAARYDAKPSRWYAVRVRP